jgi:hypothetical protein
MPIKILHWWYIQENNGKRTRTLKANYFFLQIGLTDHMISLLFVMQQPTAAQRANIYLFSRMQVLRSLTAWNMFKIFRPRREPNPNRPGLWSIHYTGWSNWAHTCCWYVFFMPLSSLRVQCKVPLRPGRKYALWYAWRQEIDYTHVWEGKHCGYRLDIVDSGYSTASSSLRQRFSNSVIPWSRKIIHKFTRFPPPHDHCQSAKTAVLHSLAGPYHAVRCQQESK